MQKYEIDKEKGEMGGRKDDGEELMGNGCSGFGFLKKMMTV